MPDVAGQIIAAEAKRVLAPFGIVRKGRSRSWIDDHGWWLINIEFQPSSDGKGCYLNVGQQHLWVSYDFFCFEDFERPLGGSSFVAFEDDVDAFATEVHRVAEAALAAVKRRRDEHREGRDALLRIAATGDDLNAGIALALLGETDTAHSKLTGRVHEAFRECAESYIGLDRLPAEEHAWTAVQETRSALRLAPTDRPAWNA